MKQKIFQWDQIKNYFQKKNFQLCFLTLQMFFSCKTFLMTENKTIFLKTGIFLLSSDSVFQCIDSDLKK